MVVSMMTSTVPFCPICGLEDEQLGHLFGQCEVAARTWSVIFRWLGIQVEGVFEPKRNDVVHEAKLIRKDMIVDSIRVFSFSWFSSRQNKPVIRPLHLLRRDSGHFIFSGEIPASSPVESAQSGLATATCCTCRVSSSTSDIVIDVNETRKIDNSIGYDLSPEIEHKLPPIITKSAIARPSSRNTQTSHSGKKVKEANKIPARKSLSGVKIRPSSPKLAVSKMIGQKSAQRKKETKAKFEQFWIEKKRQKLQQPDKILLFKYFPVKKPNVFKALESQQPDFSSSTLTTYQAASISWNIDIQENSDLSMASDSSGSIMQKPKIQIYSTTNNEVTPFWKEKYEKDAKKYWDVFYKRHQDRFFKDRHYLDKEWGHYFSEAEEKVILEVGCGAGNTIFPLAATYPGIFIHACDFSPRAVDLVKAHKDFKKEKINAFACDLTSEDLMNHISPSSVDIVTMIFVLSAVSPEKMSLVLKNIKKILKPNGYVLFRDYATGDLAQERLISKDQKISENFFVRGDGTRAFYFSEEFLTNLFQENGFFMEECGVCCKQVENRSREIVMNRRWVQAAFRVNDKTPKVSKEDEDIDISEGFAFEMFGISSPRDEIMEFKLRDWNFKIKLLSKEFQHTCKSTGLMLWESAQLMASILASNQTIVSNKTVLELGSGSGGICSMIAARTARLVVPTDGDNKTLELLQENVATNLEQSLTPNLKIKKLEWGNEQDIESVKKESGEKGFEVVIGTDVTYVAEAIVPLFKTAKELILKDGVLILCHIFRRVDEGSILSAASCFGFRLVDRWPNDKVAESSIIEGWFEGRIGNEDIGNNALNIMYFLAK
ncbi:hypothetical protein LXL04_009665 [Taraxacum kok-saghyz]